MNVKTTLVVKSLLKKSDEEKIVLFLTREQRYFQRGSLHVPEV